MSITIRKADTDDFPAIFSLFKEFSHFQKTLEKVLITLNELIADGNYFQCLVAEDADKAITGFATFFFAYYSWTGRAIYLDDLYVTNAFRDRGIGKMLLEKVIEFAKNNKCKNVRWRVSQWNTNAIDFYKKMGVEIDEIDFNCEYKV